MSRSSSSATGALRDSARTSPISATCPASSGGSAASAASAAMRAAISSAVLSPISGASEVAPASSAARVGGTGRRPEKRSSRKRNRTGRQMCRMSAALRGSLAVSPCTAAIRMPMSPITGVVGTP
jgi:hypothetical protein